MKKAHHYTVLSTKRCNAVVDPQTKLLCGKLIKKRLVETKESHNITRCYGHRDK